MKLPKLSFLQWLKLVVTVGPMLRGLVRVTGSNVLDQLRSLIDVVAAVQQAIPAEIDPATGRPVKRGPERLAAFRELVLAGLVTADEPVEDVKGAIGDLDAIGSAIVGVLNDASALP